MPTTTQTTLSAATTTDNPEKITVASATGITAGKMLWLDMQLFDVLEVVSTSIRVRPRLGIGSLHAAGAVIIVGDAGEAFYDSPIDKYGSATAASEGSLPKVNIRTGTVSDVVGGRWVPYNFNVRVANFRYTALGAITIALGNHWINGTTLAMTLAAPTRAQDGLELTVIAENASAHTLTYTAGFSGTTTSSDVATFGGAVNDNVVVVADQGVWRVKSTRNVTIA